VKLQEVTKKLNCCKQAYSSSWVRSV